MQVADIIDESVVDGLGIRTVIFCQGCPRRCEGCHNPTALEFEGGQSMGIQDLAQRILDNPLLSGVTFSGGEPFCQARELANLGKLIKDSGRNIWCYTGYTLDELLELAQSDNGIDELLHIVDVLVDGPFDISQRDLNLEFRGSSNQRLIDLPTTLQTGRISMYRIAG